MQGALRSLALCCVLLVAGCGNIVSPTSPQAEPGKPYAFELGHCGIKSPIDFDGSLWQPAIPPTTDDVYQPLRGTITLISAEEAEFRAELGARFVLRRLAGPQRVDDCL